MMIELNNHGEGKRPFSQSPLFLFTIGYFVVLVIVALLILRASSGSEAQEILRVGIGDWQSESGIVFLSGRRLDCSPTNGYSSFATVCQVEIVGKMLEIYALRNKPTTNSPFMGSCEAFYNGKQWPCSFGSRHVDVHWFAYINPPLELSGVQMEALRRHCFIENLGEEPFVYGGLLTAVAFMLVTFFSSLIIIVRITRGFWD